MSNIKNLEKLKEEFINKKSPSNRSKLFDILQDELSMGEKITLRNLLFEGDVEGVLEIISESKLYDISKTLGIDTDYYFEFIKADTTPNEFKDILFRMKKMRSELDSMINSLENKNEKFTEEFSLDDE